MTAYLHCIIIYSKICTCYQDYSLAQTILNYSTHNRGAAKHRYQSFKNILHLPNKEFQLQYHYAFSCSFVNNRKDQ